MVLILLYILQQAHSYFSVFIRNSIGLSQNNLIVETFQDSVFHSFQSFAACAISIKIIRSSLFFFQVRGHQRASSDTKEFHEVTKRDALIHFEQELKTLLETVDDENLKKFYANEMDRFSALFGRFLQEEGPSVEWDKIQKLPEDAVKNYATLSAPKDEKTVSYKSIY